MRSNSRFNRLNPLMHHAPQLKMTKRISPALPNKFFRELDRSTSRQVSKFSERRKLNFSVEFLSEAYKVEHQKPLTPSPSPQKLGVNLILANSFFVRIFGERGANEKIEMHLLARRACTLVASMPRAVLKELSLRRPTKPSRRCGLEPELERCSWL